MAHHNDRPNTRNIYTLKETIHLVRKRRQVDHKAKPKYTTSRTLEKHLKPKIQF